MDRSPDSAAGTAWFNWSGLISARPRTFAQPASEAELAALLSEHAAARVRVAGSGHSFVPLCPSSELMISLDRLQGVVSVDASRRQATVLAGTKLHSLGEPLREHGLAMESLGDIDRQSLAGAISTGTHGTGLLVGSLSTQVAALQLLTATGEPLEASGDRDPELFDAARVSLGSLGVITRVTLQLVPAFRLHERMWKVPFEQCMDELDENFEQHRHFEFFYFPKADRCAMKTLDPTERPSEILPGWDSDRFEGERVDWSDRVFPSVRERRFNEIEFALAAERGPECVAELRTLLLRRHPDIEWPLEYRRLRADSIFLSPAHGRETVTISAHQGAGLPHAGFFRDVEEVFRNHGGRPHWGKLHSHRGAELERLYPRWRAFHAARRRLDPAGRFMNRYLEELFSDPG